MERTLIVLKPDTLQRGLAGEILTRFERVGLKIVAAKLLYPDTSHYHQHYEGIGGLKTRRGDKTFEVTMDMMQMGPVLAFVLEGVEAIGQVRKMVGPTEPKSAQPGTIRGDYAHVSYGHADKEQIGIPNLVHASADPGEAELEIAHWFSEAEIYDYETVSQKFTQPKNNK